MCVPKKSYCAKHEKRQLKTKSITLRQKFDYRNDKLFEKLAVG